MCDYCNDPTHVLENEADLTIGALDRMSDAQLTRRGFVRGGAAALVSTAFTSTALPTEASAQEAAAGRIPSLGYAATASDQPLTRFEFTRAAPGAKDILVDILYCGVCHSDIHQATDNLGRGKTYPVVPGHEIVGRVRQVGAEARKFKVGQIVGVHTYINSKCTGFTEQYCQPVFTYGAKLGKGEITQGGYSSNIVVNEDYAITIPEGMDLARAAPLLCAGVTTQWPLENWKIGAGSRIAIVGLGGLGHMGLKLAVERGAEVTVFTTSPGKVEDALRLGAKDAIVWPNPRKIFARARSFDFVLTTVPYQFEMEPFMLLLKQGGTMSNVGLLGQQNLDYGYVNVLQVNLTGSFVGSVAETQNLVNHCHTNNILPEIELIPVDKINEAYDRVMNKDIKFRFVIDMSTLT